MFRLRSVSSWKMLQHLLGLPPSMSLGPSSLLWLCRRPVPDSFSAIETIISQTQSIVSNAQKWPRTQRILRPLRLLLPSLVFQIAELEQHDSDPKRCMCPCNFFAAMMSQLSLASLTIDLGPSCTVRIRSWESMLMTRTSYLTCLAAQDQRRREEFLCGQFVL